ncbi:MAG: RsmB/NOP family class I SAM-dependent RNA methyltransferase [Clostridia bacterium]|nr:RsmB/NOP family class I SAM-dependent RNA methyltransferase [Clostridia bacterium]
MENLIENEQFLRDALMSQYDEKIVEKIYNGYNTKRYVTLRINTLKSNKDSIEKVLLDNGVKFENVTWSNLALVIKNKTEKDLQELDIYKNGEIYLQSLSSMLPPIIMNPEHNEDILDMAAAPGGKTTQVAALTSNNANITACEFNKIRAERLKYNIEKQGANSVFIMQKDARNIDDFFAFDRILLDAPCSGSGTLSLKEEDSFKYFSKRLVEKSAKIQFELLKKALKILKPGKELIYSTCSILSLENEEIVTKALNNAKAEIVPIEFAGMECLPLLPVKIPGTLCICPNELYEGFFVAKIRKIG